MMHPVGRLVAVFVWSGLVAAVAHAQECGPDQVTPWWPRANTIAGSESLHAAERAMVVAQLGAVEALMRRTPYATPRGFAVRPQFAYHEITNRNQPYRHEFALNTYSRCSKYDEHGADIIVGFNPGPMAWSEGDRPMLDEGGDSLYAERIRTATQFGATATFGGFHEEISEGLFVLFTAGGQSPTLPVSREEYLRAMIFTLEGKDQEKVKAAAAITSKTPYERWMQEAPERRKRNEELYAIVAKTNPAQAAKMRADMEKAELAETEKLRKSDAYERAQVNRNLAGLTVLGDRYRAQIAAMSPLERASAALLVGNDLVPAGTPNAGAIVRRNPAFYRVVGSPVQPRAIIVRMPNAYKEYWPQQEQLYRQLDWAAIKRMVH